MYLPAHIKDKAMDFTLTKNDFGSVNDFNVDDFITVCKNYPWFFIESFMRVRNVQGRYQPARLNRAQKYMEKVRLEQLRHYPFVHILALKIRQTGLSWICSKWEVWAAIFYNFYCDILSSAKDDVAITTIMGYVYEALNDLREQARVHKFLLPYLITPIERNDKIKFLGLNNDGGRIEALAASKQAVSRSSQFAHFTEVSRIRNWSEVWGSYSPSLHLDTHHYCILESTAHYAGNHFMEMYHEQKELERNSSKPPEMRAIFIPVYMNDNYIQVPLPIDEGGVEYNWDRFFEDGKYADGKPMEDLYGDEEELIGRKWYDPLDEKWISLPLNFWYWRRVKINLQKADKMLGFTKLQIFQQDYPMDEAEAELIAGENAYPRGLLIKRRKMVSKPIFTGDINIDKLGKVSETANDRKYIYSRWDWVKDGMKYFIGIDTSNAKGGDSSVVSVYSLFQNAIVAELVSNRISTHDLAEKSIAIAKYWNNALIAYEVNLTAIGETMKRKYLGTDIEVPNGAPYRNLYKRVPINTSFNKISKNPTLGFQLDPSRKNAIRYIWRDMLENMDSGIWSKELIEELWNWRQDMKNKDGDLKVTCSAPKGKHDDRIIAGGIAIFIAAETSGRTDMRNQMGEYCPTMGANYREMDLPPLPGTGNKVNLWDRYRDNRKHAEVGARW